MNLTEGGLGEPGKKFLALAAYTINWPHDTQHNETQHNDTQHNDTRHTYTQHNNTATMLSVIMLNVIIENKAQSNFFVSSSLHYKTVPRHSA